MLLPEALDFIDQQVDIPYLDKQYVAFLLAMFLRRKKKRVTFTWFSVLLGMGVEPGASVGARARHGRDLLDRMVNNRSFQATPTSAVAAWWRIAASLDHSGEAGESETLAHRRGGRLGSDLRADVSGLPVRRRRRVCCC